MRCTTPPNIVITLICLLVISACGDDTTVQPEQRGETINDDAVDDVNAADVTHDLDGGEDLTAGSDGLSDGEDLTDDTTPHHPTCGDGVLNAGESCDGDALGGEDCAGLGFESGALMCADTCTFNTSGCVPITPPSCGDGARADDEVCDGDDLAGQDCSTQGFDDGPLSCLEGCMGFDTSACTSVLLEICDNGVDDDSDGLADCADADCSAAPECVNPVEDCTNGVDDDGDALADCADADCSAAPECVNPVEDCTNGVDDDSDALADCADADCAADLACELSGELTCDDAFDNDADGLSDCADPDCSGVVGCPETEADDATCSDSIDNDGNGFTDCLDWSCTFNPDVTLCGVISSESDNEACSDNVDNDGNGFTDCADFWCSRNPTITACGEVCGDAVDNDVDGFTDCDDSECSDELACAPEVCNNGVDDDGDGLADCADVDCSAAPECVNPVEDCTNGVDDDGDGLADCADADCSAAPECVNPVEDCTNGVDDDSDALADCADADCAADLACELSGELTCDDAFDNDADGLSDCADPDCWLNEPVMCPLGCALSDAGSTVGDGAITGTTIGQGNDGETACDSGVAEDAAHTWTAPTSGCYIFDTTDSLFVTSLELRTECSGSSALVCDNGNRTYANSSFISEVVAGTKYVLWVDGRTGSAGGDYVVNIDTTGLSTCFENEASCNNGFDDNGDGKIDCSDSECNANADLGSSVGASITTGSNIGEDDNGVMSCAGLGGDDQGEDVIFTWTAPASGTYQVDTIGSTYDTVLEVRPDRCSVTVLACDDEGGGGPGNSLLWFDAVAGEEYAIWLDAWESSEAGGYVLNINLVEGVCDDGLDGDGDGVIDCLDPDCAVVPACEVCDNGVDDNGDGVIDCMDPTCDDAHEENDTLLTGALISAPFTGTGLSSCPGDDDYYQISVSAGDAITVGLAFQHASGDLNVSLYDPNQIVRAQSTTGDDDESFVWNAGMSGVWTVRVFSADGLPNSYDISINH